MSATLSELTIGSLTLTPAFDPGTLSYTAATTNATNKVTAVAYDPDAELTIKVGDTEIDSGDSATWAAGENVVTIKVVDGNVTKTYTVTVTATVTTS